MRFETSSDAPAQVLSVAVDPAHQGKGIGKRLVRAGMEHLWAKGVKAVKLEVRPGNTPALKTYARLGFKPGGRARDLQGEWIIMVWNA